MSKKFTSKKNKVYLEKNRIVKVFLSRDKLDKEVNMYKKLENTSIKTPKLIFKGEDRISLEYINGDLVLDLFIKAEEENSYEVKYLLKKLIDTLLEFNKITQEIFYDINLRNFLVFNNDIYIIDFEDTKTGYVEEDLGRFLAFILTYDPVFTKYKLEICKELEEYISSIGNIDFSLVLKCKEEELIRIKSRRRIK